MTKRSTWEQRGKGLVERFEEKVKKGAGCWLWQSAFGTNGYGFFWVGGKKRQEYAHRVAWRIANDWQEVPEGKVVMHSCDNKACVNPSHLSLGTSKDNSQDALKKGRYHTGERNKGGGKLDLSKAAQIRALKGEVGSTTLGRRYGVTKTTVLAIWHGRIWKDARQQ